MAKLQQLLKTAILSMAALFCIAGGAQEKRAGGVQEKRRVAVFEPTGNPTVTTMNKFNVRGALTEILVNSSTYTALDRNQIDKILAEQRFQREDLADASKAKRLGELLGADLICVTEMLKENGEISIICTITDVETGEIANNASEFLENDSNVSIRRAVGELASRMFGIKLPSQVKARQQAEKKQQAEREKAEREARRKAEKDTPKQGGNSILNKLVPTSIFNREKNADREAREVRERVDREARARADREARARDAKSTVNRLMPDFTFEKKGSAISFTNKAMEQYLNEQQQLVIKKRQDFWHSLVVKIDRSNALIAHSKYVFRNSKNKLSHTQLSIIINEEVIATDLKLSTSNSSTLGITTEEAEILSPDVLNIIADFSEKQVQVRIGNNSGANKTYILNPVVQRAIAQTVQLHKAIGVLTQQGVEIQQSYLL